ncbi:hypothetical protein [Actinoplanes sp. DH11]|uniref:hypothetical protein n=1 Tax=Actinoplanes sp. DH11 TaxID=2857011 RepID=UPI001E4FF15F|nr:hypothetical protein [Actinoplanes sp. DH11]
MSALPGRLVTTASAILLAVGCCPVPATAAPARPTITAYFPQLTLTPGGEAFEPGLWASIVTGEDDSPLATIRYVVDFSDVTGFADVELSEVVESGYLRDDIAVRSAGGATSSAAPDEGCRAGGDTFTCTTRQYVGGMTPLLALAFFQVTPKPGGVAGDSGTVRVTASVDDGPESTAESLIRIGEGVNLAATEAAPVEAAPGAEVPVDTRVRNTGSTVADGVTLYLGVRREALVPTSYRNCVYSVVVFCTFDTRIQPGSTYALTEPIRLRTPADSIDGSVLDAELAWTTATEWEDMVASMPIDRLLPGAEPGTGGELTLTEVVAAAGTPQVELEPDDNSTAFTLTVTGGRTPDLAAIGTEVKGRTGEEVALRVGRVNNGPGRLHPELFDNNLLPIVVEPPRGTRVGGVDGDCEGTGTDGNFYCYTNTALAPGTREHLEFTLVVQEKPDEAGQVRAPALAVDPRPKNNTAPLVVTVAVGDDDLPITGPGGLLAAGVLLLVVGGFGRWLARRPAVPRR